MHPYEPHPNDEQEDSWPRQPAQPSKVNPNLARRARGLVLRHWDPKKLEPPGIDPELLHLTPVERASEVFRYTVLSLEYWLSSGGALREWIRLNLRVALTLAVPSLLVVPLITFALREINVWVALVIASTSNFILFPLSALLIVGLISALVHLARSVLAARHPQRDRDRPYY
jgi:hypothetical protein